MIDHSTFDFLGDLKKNNRWDWHNAKKGLFKDSQNNFIDFVAMILFRISELDPYMLAVWPKDCLVRIYKPNFFPCVLF